MRRDPPSIPRRIVLGLSLLAIALGGPPAAAAAGPSTPTAADKLPDLRMALLSDMRVEEEPTGELYLRFTTISMNIGTGPFEVRGTVKPDDATMMTTNQRIYDVNGGHRDVDTRAVAMWSGDGHDHWHIQKMQRYQLWSSTSPDAPVLKGAKTGFCFFDGVAKRRHLPGYSPATHYQYAGCGNSPSNTSITMGLSVGWGDVYPWSIAFQWIDISDVASGDYRLCVTIDSQHFYRESDRTNNQVYSDITLDMDAPHPTVTTVARAWAPCR